MMELTKKGLYIAEDLTNQCQYLVAVDGTAPMLRIVNVLSIDLFVNPKLELGFEALTEPILDAETITRRVQEFSWTPLAHKLVKPTPKETITTLKSYPVIEENYNRFKELLTVGEDEKVLIEICTNADISMEKGRELLKQLKLSCRS